MNSHLGQDLYYAALLQSIVQQYLVVKSLKDEPCPCFSLNSNSIIYSEAACLLNKRAFNLSKDLQFSILNKFSF